MIIYSAPALDRRPHPERHPVARLAPVPLGEAQAAHAVQHLPAPSRPGSRRGSPRAPGRSRRARSGISGRICSGTTLTRARSKRGLSRRAARRPANRRGWRPLRPLLSRAWKGEAGSTSKPTTDRAPKARAAKARTPVPVPTSSTRRPLTSASSRSSSASEVDSWLPVPNAARAGSRRSRRPSGDLGRLVVRLPGIDEQRASRRGTAGPARARRRTSPRPGPSPLRPPRSRE